MAIIIEVPLDPEGNETCYINADLIRYFRKHQHGPETTIHFDEGHSIPIAMTPQDLMAKISRMK